MQADEDLQDWVQERRNSTTDEISKWTDKYTKRTTGLTMGGFYLGGMIFRNQKAKETAFLCLESVALAEGITKGLKYLVGRIFLFTLYPLSFGEFLNYKDRALYGIFREGNPSETSIKAIGRFYNEYVIYGGYPRVVLEKDEDKKKEILKGIYNTYLLREIKEILQITEDELVNKIIKALALQVGSIANFNELSSTTEIESYKLKKYALILRKTFVCFESRPYFRNKRKELVKAPRFYFFDNGFRNIALDNLQPLEIRADQGALNENFAASEIIKKDLQTNYWRTKAGAEVDFVIEKSGELIPIEVKSTLKYVKYTRSFRNFISEYKPKRGVILSKNLLEKSRINNTEIRFAPLFMVSQFV